MNKFPSRRTLNKVEVEVAKARGKFPGNHKLLAALVEEVGELAQAMLQKKAKSEIEKEAAQVACVAIRLLEEGDGDFQVNNWNPAP